MMEQAQRRVSEHDIMLVRRLDTLRVHHAPTRCREVFDTAAERAVDIVREREERVARARDATELLRVFRALGLRQRLRDRLEEALPLLALAALEQLAADEEVDRVRLLCALDALLEGQREHARVVAQPPEVRFVACETRAVDARLLAGADADDGTAVRVRDAI